MSKGLDDVQAGDVVCKYSGHGVAWTAAIVTRTTARRVFIGYSEYDRKTGRLRGSGVFNCASIMPLTPERIEEARLDVLKRAREQAVNERVNRIISYRLRELSVEQLERMLAIIEEARP